MKYLFLLFILYIYSINCIGQTTKELDIENGYKDFKLGDLKTKWETAITPTRTKDYANYYRYTGNCCDTFFGEPVKYINLMFDHNNKLEKIAVILEPISQLDNLNAMKQRLLKAYGKDDASIAQDNLGGFEIIWQGKIIHLAVHAFPVKGKFQTGINYSPASFSQ